MKQTLVVYTLALLVALAGCNHEPAAPVQSYPQQSSVDLGARAQLTDKLNAQMPEAVAPAPGYDPIWPSNPNVDAYAVTLLWGTLANTAATPHPTDWSGTLRLFPSGEVKVATIISFEPGQDSVLGTNNPLLAAWASQTLADVDGLQFLIFVDKNSPLTVVPTITITTQPVSLSLGIIRLVKLDTIIFADNQNAMVIVARKLPRSNCPRGVIAGSWIKDDISGQSGTFDGKWIGPSNTQSGFIAGTFWSDIAGGHYFAGKYTDMINQIVGYLKGKWNYDDPRMCPVCGSGHGFFTGVFTNLDSVAIGEVAGEFGDLTAPWNELKMPYRGIWKLWCPNPEPSNDISGN